MKQRHLDYPAPGAIPPAPWRILLAALIVAGCASPGAPAPPSLNLAEPVQNLSVARIDNAVHLAWTMPTRTTDRVTLKRAVPADICRKIADGPCTTIAVVPFDPGKPAAYIDTLPGALSSGPTRLLTYRVRLRNRAQKTAGPSNPAFSAAGPAPAALSGLTAQVRRDGVLLSWHPATQAVIPAQNETRSFVDFRIDRVLETPPAKDQETTLAAPEPTEQTLVVHGPNDTDPGQALDTDAQLNRRYRYTVERVATLVLAGHSVEIQGRPSDPLSIATTDVFAPDTPRGLAAVADPAAGAIDLSWTPDTGKDLAGYYVYRRDLGSSLPVRRIAPQSSSQGPITVPAFHDPEVERGHAYAYSVSAVSQGGYESHRSPEVTETLPNQ